MKTGNTLRMAKNSLLCFFMALAGGFLVACGSSGSGSGSGGVSVPSSPGVPTFSQPSVTDNFRSYLSDTAAEGVEYSGPTFNGVTGEGGVFWANEGVFEFSIGATTLGSIRVTSDQEGNEVTPADFMDVDEAQVITIARIMQGLDEDGALTNGISISQNTRENAPNLFTIINSDEQMATGPIGGKNFMIPPVAAASIHLADTRKCLFSGGYVGDYSGVDTSNDPLAGGRVYYAVEPFADRVRRFGLDAAAVDTFEISPVGVTGSEISLSSGNTLSFITPRLVAGRWADDAIGMGTHTLSLAADTGGNPGATRRIVGVQTTDDDPADMVAVMYVLDYFEEATVFRGRYYDVDAISGVVSMPLSLTIADGGSWPTDDATLTTLTLIGMRGDEGNEVDTIITVGVVRTNDNYGSFDGVNIGDNELSGTWCDIGGAVGSTVAPTPPTPSIEVTVTWSEVPGATSYKLYRSTMTVSVAYTQVGGDISMTTYVDTPPAGPKYFYQLEACNSAGCSERSSDPDPAAGGGDGGDGNGNGNGGGGGGGGGNGDAPAQPSAPSASAQSDTEIEVTWSAVSGATSYKLYRSESSGGTYTQVGGDISALRYLDTGRSASTEYFYQLEACNSAGCSATRSPEVSATTQAAADDGQCKVGDVLPAGESCEYKTLTFTVRSDGYVQFGSGIFLSAGRIEHRGATINGVSVAVFVATRSGTTWTITELVL